MSQDSVTFFDQLSETHDFGALSDDAQYTPLPDDWWVGSSDIVGSTKAIAEGHYKTVNMIAAAVISSQINAHGGAPFPFVFGGDGASFAIPAQWHAAAAQALSETRMWTREEFGMDLRVALTPVTEIRAAGQDVRVARFRPSDAVGYAMFAGGGLSWAETQMKAGAYGLAEAASGARPDLTGLSCRWSNMSSQLGSILSLVIVPTPRADAAKYARLMQAVLATTKCLRQGGHPSPEVGPGVDWPPKGAWLEAQAQYGGGSLRLAYAQVLFESFLAWLLVRTGVHLGGFDARRYRKVVGQNADFRKFDDGLKMTLDCDPETETQLRQILDEGVADGVIRYGIHKQDEAMMTCIVPSIQSDDHVHFVDGAAGGYTEAAKVLKAGV